jgi:hypothetical protein
VRGVRPERARRCEPFGTVGEFAAVRGRLVYALHPYPGEPRLQKRLQLVDRALDAPAGAEAIAPEPSPVSETVTEAPIPLPKVITAANWTRGKVFGVAAAVLLLSLAAFFGARHNATGSRPDAAAKTYVVPAEPKLEAKKEVSVAPPRAETVIKVHVPHKKATVPVAPAPLPPPEGIDVAGDAKLAQVQWNNRETMQGVEQAEKTLHEQIETKRKAALAALAREQAEQALAPLHARESELAAASNAVTAMLQRYVDAWNAKDVERITALHRSLDRRTVKAQLAPATATCMTITPASAAQVDGERATIVCRQVNERFSDGTEKQSPALLVIFTLSKRDGQWSIDGTQ